MAKALEQFLGRLEQASNLDDLQDLILDLRGMVDVDHTVYHWVSSDGEQYGCGTYPPEWVQHYVENDYIRIDPVVQGCYQRFHPVDWKRLDWSSKSARAFLQNALKHGVGNQGLSVPIRGPNGQFAMFTVSHHCSDEEWAAFIEEWQRDLIVIAHYFNQKALEIAGDRAPERTKALSPRETDALTFLAMGYGRGQVSEMLAISEHTLRVYIESARFKLGAANTTHAVAKALAEGLILIGGAARGSAGDWPGRKQAAE
ncbi:LuxR family transcriptional regulator [Marivivens donghaensis]|uniref:LuxR family transcriptional regulator n=1 Tax=Marivivens donghaensis TaxID=1699413 RepID=A0ABX0VWD2_9RHOB|nr:LuxR family transcriptional regulator [Marivivens donghaensis]NIY72124.1 LuxR family transcriptional regulator [Marivivens donghaensis]